MKKVDAFSQDIYFCQNPIYIAYMREERHDAKNEKYSHDIACFLVYVVVKTTFLPAKLTANLQNVSLLQKIANFSISKS